VDARQFGRRVDQLKAVDEQLNLTTPRGDVGLANTIANARSPRGSSLDRARYSY